LKNTGFDVKSNQPKAITVELLGDEYQKIRYNPYQACRCDKVLNVIPE
jgi:hypothetical protein